MVLLASAPTVVAAMEPALDVLHRALQGDEGARSFLDRTSSIYVLDATDISKPHTYGCWNFIHQAMNEMERAEGNLHRQASTSSSSHHHDHDISSIQFVAHAQLLATMALRVARRSNAMDKKLVATCIENAASQSSHYHGSTALEAQRLMDINVEIRDIVMGRLAALALDPSFHHAHHHHHHRHQHDQHHKNNNFHDKSGNHHHYVSAFSDTVVLETFCAVLAANAVSNGPSAVRHLVSEWIVPSSQHLPPFCVACITLHLAEEASRRLAPAGTQDVLQQLSTVVMASVLAPVLTEAVKESSSGTTREDDEDQDAEDDHDDRGLSKSTTSSSSASSSLHREMNCRIAALSLRAINQWCAVTDLSLAQIKHICNKVRINIVDTLNDAMYSDSRLVVDALAEFMESVMERHQVVAVSDRRMNQVRYIMQVEIDEEFFRSNITAEQLVTIESKEMAVILEELVSSVGLQRFRFVDRQAKGDDEVCRNLARMAASICDACRGVSTEGRPVKIGPGLLELLLKAAAHPSADISGIALEVLTEEISSETGLVHQLLPILQGRAITPHKFTNDDDGQMIIPSIQPQSGCDGFTGFDQFRNTTLTECLQACWQVQPKIYLSSCAAAIDEFCRSASIQVSFHLEAALFCMNAVAIEQALFLSSRSGSRSGGGDPTSDMMMMVSPYLGECMAALSTKPASLMSNPLTLAQACRFVDKYSKWFASSNVEGVLDQAADLALSTFNLCASGFPYEMAAVEMRQEGNVSPYADAAQALKSLLVQAPTHFLSNQAIAALGAGWEASYAAANRTDILELQDREAIAVGICHVLAALPENQQGKSLLALAMPALNCLDAMLQHAREVDAVDNTSSSSQRLDAILDRLASEIVMVTTIATAVSSAFNNNSQGRITIREPALTIIKRAWPFMSTAATQYNSRKTISDALQMFLTRCLPPSTDMDELAGSMIEQLCQLASSIVENKKATENEEWNFAPVMAFLQTMVEIHGADIDQAARLSLNGEPKGGEAKERARRIGQALESLLLMTAEGVQTLLGPTWTSGQRQGNGQQAFESKSQIQDHGPPRQVSRTALAPMLSVLQTFAQQCPIFLLHLPVAKDQDRNEDVLVRLAIESAVASILDPDVDTSTSCMDYLESCLEIATVSSSDPAVRQSMEEILSRVRREMLTFLLVGICGKFGTGVNLVSAAKLLHRLLGTFSSNIDEGRATIISAFSGTTNNNNSNNYFILGPRAYNVVMECLFKTCQNQVTLEQLEEFVEQIWDLHHSDSAEQALTGSESVSRFCQRYSSTS